MLPYVENIIVLKALCMLLSTRLFIPDKLSSLVNSTVENLKQTLLFFSFSENSGFVRRIFFVFYQRGRYYFILNLAVTLPLKCFSLNKPLKAFSFMVK